MSKLVIKVKKKMGDNDRERLEAQIKKDLDTNGFVVIDNNFDVYEINEGADK